MTHSGVHMPNQAIQQADLDLVKSMGAGAASAKLLHIQSCQHSSRDVTRLRGGGVQNFVVRCADTRMADGRFPSFDEYANYVVGTVNEFYPMGVRLFQISNEDQYLWDSLDYGPWQAQFFYRKALPIIRRSVPADVKLIAPPLSFSPALWSHNPSNPTAWVLDDWFAAYQWTDAGRVPMFWQLFDYVGANVYWTGANRLKDPSYGMSYRQIHQRSQGMPIVICEYGSSAHLVFTPDGTRRYTDAEVDAIRCETYPAFLEMAEAEGYVQSAHIFVMNPTPDWRGYAITPTVGQAVKLWADTHEQVNA